jgi:hypothetical protein
VIPDARRYRAVVTASAALHTRPDAMGMPMARRALVHGLVVGGLVFLAYTFLVAAPRTGTVGFDAYAYWAVQLPNPYEVPVGSLGAFTYSPPVALLSHLVSGFPFWAFLWVWMAVLVATAVFLGGRRALLVLAFPPVAMELYHGNVHLLIAAAIVLGFRHPWTWSIVLLTKPTGGVGLLWFAARREWRNLAIALGATLAIVAVSLVIAPRMWLDWIDYLLANMSVAPGGAWVPIPLWVRVPAAAALVIWGARTDRVWTVPVATTIALPMLWFTGFAVLVALVRLPHLERRGTDLRAAGRPGITPALARP